MAFSNNLTEKEMLLDLMTSEKELSNLYNNAVSECINPILRRILFQCILNSQDVHLAIYDAVSKRGWINIKTANKRDIEQTVKSFKEEF
jgi:spore coat protein CotF